MRSAASSAIEEFKDEKEVSGTLKGCQFNPKFKINCIEEEPLIQKISFETLSGYDFIRYKNGTSDKVFYEKVEFLKEFNVTLCYPDEGNSYEVKLEPG